MKNSTEPEWGTREANFEYLLDSGLLYYINRTVLHPLGLALTMKRNEQGGVVLSEQLKDLRDKPALALFDKTQLALGDEKIKKFMSQFGSKQMDKRRKTLGWSVQQRYEK